ncbi:MAG TPA: MBL fold metallo-hydrolase [Lentisphaeria bacterium]|nr:MBL fold metallo-hydrolase [Lentisphaeria bacterium]
MSRITIVVDNQTSRGLAVEHGLSLVIDNPAGRFLFDTGAGAALLLNAGALGITTDSLRRVILSHGHYDHTGGLAALTAAVPGLEVFAAPGVTQRRYSCHPGQPVRELTMPENCRHALETAAEHHVIADFTEIAPQVFLTGPIPRRSGEDCGGPFFLDSACQKPDLLMDEQALLLGEGTLVQGCCHSGIINTLEYCRQRAPHISVRTLIGGLHLRRATPERLRQTADCLLGLNLRQLVLLHCTGETACAYLQEKLRCPVHVARSGETYEC